MFGQTLAIAKNTFLESVRQPIYFVLLVFGGLLQAFNTLMSAYSLGYTDSSEVSGDNKLLLDLGLATVFVVSTLLAALIATAVLSKEIENKTALTVISKPVGRPVFIIGKFLGATGAIVLATLIMLIYFQLALRHGVMTTARDHLDGPVILFVFLAILLGVGVGIWCNFFYGWVFSSTAAFVMSPALVLAWVATLFVNAEWEIQPFATDWKPQIMLASACVLLAMPVLAAIAVTASTRLGQVMTIVVCAGAFVMGLLSNHLLGRFAFSNEILATIVNVEAENDADGDFADPGDVYVITLDGPTRENLEPGASIYLGPSPNGIGLIVPKHGDFEGDVTKENDLFEESSPSCVMLAYDVDPPRMTIANAGGLAITRPPAVGDYVFLQPTTVRPVAWAAWSIVPNLQFFWLVDAVTQTHTIPASYLLMMSIYSAAQVIALLSLAVILFQDRDVG